jgi:Osmosensitive K+ channel histidine kinase
MLKVRVVLLLPEDGSIVVKTGYPPEDILDEADVAAAKWAVAERPGRRARLGHTPGSESACSCRCGPAAAHRRHGNR